MNVTVSQAKTLLRLRSGEWMPRSALPSGLRAVLLEKGACLLESSATGRGRIKAVEQNFDRVVRDVLRVKDLSGLANLSSERTRTDVASVSAHSKTLRANPLRGGWMLRAIGHAEIQVGSLIQTNHPVGCSLFVQKKETSKVRVKGNCLLGVENADTFLRAELLFREIPTSAIIMLRWGWGEYWREWVGAFPGSVGYLGDYDPGGLSIFQDVVLSARPDARFLMPNNLPDLLKRGDHSRFHKQEFILKRLVASTHPDIASALSAIRSARKGLDQESLTNGTLALMPG